MPAPSILVVDDEPDIRELVGEILADEGYDPVFGARPLKRVIQRALQDPLAEMLLAGDIADGETVHVSAGAEGLIIGEGPESPSPSETPAAPFSSNPLETLNRKGGL